MGLFVILLGFESFVQAQNINPTIEKVKKAMLCMQRRSWEQGTAMQALMEIGDTTAVILMAHEAIIWQSKDGRLAMCGSADNISDPAVNGPGMLFAYKVTGDAKYKKAADDLFNYFKKPEAKTPNGYIRHNLKSMQIFSDNTFMQVPFFAMMGDYKEALFQLEGMRTTHWDASKKLLRHIYDDEKKFWNDSSHWGGGNGWNVAAMAQLIELLPNEMIAEKQRVIAYCTELLDGCIAYMRPDGFFYDKIDEPNFVETNLGNMLAYTIYKGIKAGWLDKKYLVSADKMRAATYTKIDKSGLIHDASSSPGFNRPGTSTECQAFFLLMEGAYLKLNK